MKQWHLEARAARHRGCTVKEIADHFGKSRATVAWVLDEHNDRERNRDRVRRRRGTLHPQGPRSIEPHKARAITVAVSPAVKAEACRAFAAGAIDRDELSRRLRGEAAADQQI